MTIFGETQSFDRSVSPNYPKAAGSGGSGIDARFSCCTRRTAARRQPRSHSGAQKARRSSHAKLLLQICRRGRVQKHEPLPWAADVEGGLAHEGGLVEAAED